MKTNLRTAAIILAAACIAISAMSCMTTTKVTTTHPDGRVEVTEITAPAPGSVETAGALAQTAARIAAAKYQVQPEK